MFYYFLFFCIEFLNYIKLHVTLFILIFAIQILQSKFMILRVITVDVSQRYGIE